MTDESSRAILYLLYEGRTPEEIVKLHPTLTLLDVSRAAGEGLRALEEASARAPETRADRIARVREEHPRAFFAWAEEEDVRLALRWREGARVADLMRALGRPRGAITMRLEKLFGPDWRDAKDSGAPAPWRDVATPRA